MVGMGPGEAREIATTVGDTWWEPEPLRGVDLRCDITLKEVFEWDLPQVRRPPAIRIFAVLEFRDCGSGVPRGNLWWEPEALRGVGLRCDITLKEVVE
jgi:hypothetical protein